MAMLNLCPLHINDLPTEILLHILQQLPHGDICSAYQVCTRWQAIAEDKSMWKHYQLEMKLEQEEDISVFSTHPYKNVPYISVEVTGNSNVPTSILAPKLFSSLLENQIEMETLRIFGTNADFTSVPTADLVRLASEVNYLAFESNLCYSDVTSIKLTDAQLNSLFNTLEQEPCSLLYLTLGNMDLTHLNVNFVTNDLSRLDLHGSKLSDHQLNSLFYALEQEPRDPMSLCLSGIDLTCVNATTLANGCKSISDLNLESSKMLFGQFKALISTLATADNVEIIRLNLRNLESSENFMENLPREYVDHLVTLAGKIEELHVDLNQLNDSNFAHFISALSKKSMREFTCLDLSFCEFAQVNIKELSNLLSKLSCVDMVNICVQGMLSRAQWAFLFSDLAKKMAINQCNLTNVSFSGNDLSRVAPGDLSGVITKLSYVNLNGTKLSSKQSRNLLKSIITEADIKLESIEAGAGKNNVFKRVPKALIDAAKSKKNIKFLY